MVYGNGRAGLGAQERYRRLRAGADRPNLMRLRFALWPLAVALMAMAAVLGRDPASYWFGFVTASLIVSYSALGLDLPQVITTRREGARAERRTAKVLAGLPDEFVPGHGPTGGPAAGARVLVTPSGVFLLETKVRRGTTSVEDDALVTRREHSDEDVVDRRIGPRMREGAAGLKRDIERRTGVSLWVEPVVVLWGRFPQRVGRSEGVDYVHGDELERWLRSRPGELLPKQYLAAVSYLEQAPPAAPPPGTRPWARLRDLLDV